MHGTVARMKHDKRFGFISDGTTDDYFFHESCLQRSSKPFEDIREGDSVEFTPVEGPKGHRAIEVIAR